MTRRTGEDGYVTAETAMAIPALVLVLAAGLWAIAVVTAQLACVDAARAGARAAARGEPIHDVRTEVIRAAPPHATASVIDEGDLTKVVVTAVVRPNWGAALPSITVTATASSATEREFDHHPEARHG
ncbi:TadE family type IV pilus minor pilin [Thermopolyspora sp. NPDC052614]|uniref:TadE family type IV pilus minor pilin n=1 Tax=Thermopolyspora sp. NPDC052614 TaxID=3155682 RepID=UPI00343CA967